MSLIKGESGEWEIVLGLEVHAQVISDAKLFSGAPTAFGADPNTQVSLVDAAMPGMLPVINERCIEQAVRTGLGLNAKINLRSVFDRKYYFFPDLPAGYQISQYKDPIEYEARRQVEIIEGGGKIVQETRRFDAGRGETQSMRSKEDAHDYRYFPDPDLLPLILKQEFVDGIRKSLPELPDAKKARFTRDYGLTPYDAGVLVAE